MSSENINKIKNNNSEFISLLKELSDIVDDFNDNSSIEELESINKELNSLDEIYDNFKSFVKTMFLKVSKTFDDEDIDYESYFVKLVEESNTEQIKEYFGALAKKKHYEGFYYLGRFFLYGVSGVFGERRYVDYKKALFFLKKAYSLNKNDINLNYYFSIAMFKNGNIGNYLKILMKNLEDNSHAKSGYELLSYYREKEFLEKNSDKKIEYSGIIRKIQLILG